jgi:hypothetical protein
MKITLLALLTATASFAASPSFTVPVMGNINGASATYRTFISLSNERDTDQRVRVEWIGYNGDRTNRDALIWTIPARTVVMNRSVVNNIIGSAADAFGSARFVAIKDDGTSDPDGRIDATTQIAAFLPLARGGGSFRQDVTSVPDEELGHNGDVLTLFGALMSNQLSRTNVGLVNMDYAREQTFHIEVYSFFNEESFDVTVPAGAMTQVPVETSITQEFQLRISRTTQSDAPWTAYASSIDRQTGAAWTASRLTKGFRLY